MIRYAALLRGINVTGRNLVKMDALKKIFTEAGFGDVVTYIQSGNVLFNASEQSNRTLQQNIEQLLLENLGFPVTTITRTIAEIQQVIAENPFADLAENDTRKLYVTFLETTPTPDKAEALQTLCNSGDEQMTISGTSLYFVTPSYGNTKFSNNFVEKKLGLAATTRNWATVNKVVGM